VTERGSNRDRLSRGKVLLVQLNSILIGHDRTCPNAFIAHGERPGVPWRGLLGRLQLERVGGILRRFREVELIWAPLQAMVVVGAPYAITTILGTNGGAPGLLPECEFLEARTCHERIFAPDDAEN
jgi:hypothetical protein